MDPALHGIKEPGPKRGYDSAQVGGRSAVDELCFGTMYPRPSECRIGAGGIYRTIRAGEGWTRRTASTGWPGAFPGSIVDMGPVRVNEELRDPAAWCLDGLGSVERAIGTSVGSISELAEGDGEVLGPEIGESERSEVSALAAGPMLALTDLGGLVGG